MNDGTGAERSIGGREFRFVVTIEPTRDAAGSVSSYTHSVPSGIRLNPYGRGPFCRFAFPANWPYAGVYALVVDGMVVYVGECENLSRRFGPQGYGTIARRNCLSDGQATNCKINARIAVAAAGGSQVEVWFGPTDHRLDVERQLIAELKPPWNSRGGRHSIGGRPTQGGRTAMPTADDFRQALRAAFAEADRSGTLSVTVRAGDLHRRVGGYPGGNHRMPVCCDVMRSAMIVGDRVVSEPPSGKGARLAIRYRLPRPRPV